ncbi:MAG: DUF4835 family protein [Saprospiraceae bacterium]
MLSTFKNIVLVFTIGLSLSDDILCQELDLSVVVVGPTSASSTDKSVFPLMEKAIKELANNQKWTTDHFDPNERIKCKMQLSVRSDNGNGNFKCDLLIDASRPVFGSAYETSLFVVNEKDIPISFEGYKPLENNKETYTDNLSALITFYAYYILAMDYDSFSLEGGDTYINILQNMLASLPGNAKGFDESWSSSSNKKNSRFFLLENLTNIRMKPFRRANYEYHRICLDNIAKSPESARSQMISSLEAIAATDVTYPNSFLLQSFLSAKRIEIIEIFKGGTMDEKNKVINTMSTVDPSNTTAYNSIKS